MRYLKHVTTGDVVAVRDDDDARFEELKTERLGNGRAAWQQTGAHDPAVLDIEVAGQDPPNGTEPETPGASTVTSDETAAQQLAVDQNAILRDRVVELEEQLDDQGDELADLRKAAASSSADSRVADLEAQVKTLTGERDEALAVVEQLGTEKGQLEQQLTEATAPPKSADGERSPTRARSGGR